MESTENAFSLPHPENPYVYDAPLAAGGTFFGRTELLETIAEELHSEESRLFLLRGPEHMGKTSLLLHLADRLKEPFLPVYFDLNGRSSQPLPLLVRDLASEIVSAAGGTPAPRRRLEDVGQAHWMLLQALHDAVLGRRLVLLFDQFDAPPTTLSEDASGLRLFPYLQELSRLPAAPVFIIAGDRQLELPAETASLPLFQSASIHHLSVLTATEARQLLVEPSKGHCVYEPQAIKAALDQTGRHPWLLQMLASQLFELPRRRALDPLRTLEVAACVPRALAEAQIQLEALWQSLTAHEQVLLSVIAQFSPPERPVRLEELTALLEAHSARMGDTELVDGLAGLAELELIQREGSGRLYCGAGMIRTWTIEHHRFVVASSSVQKSATKRRQERAAAARQRDQMAMSLSLQGERKGPPDAVEDLWNVAESQLGARAGETLTPVPRRPAAIAPLGAPPVRHEVELAPKGSAPPPAETAPKASAPPRSQRAAQKTRIQTTFQDVAPEVSVQQPLPELELDLSAHTLAPAAAVVSAPGAASVSVPVAAPAAAPVPAPAAASVPAPVAPPLSAPIPTPVAASVAAPVSVATSASIPDEFDRHMNAGQDAYVQGKLEVAVDAYRKALSIEPGHVEATLGLGRALLESHEYAAAVQVLQSGAGQSPDLYFEATGEVYLRWLDEVEHDEEMWALVMDEAVRALPGHSDLARRQRGAGALRVRRLLTDGRPVEAAAALGALGADLHDALPEVLAPLLEALETLTRRGLPDADPLFTLLRRLLPEPRAAWQRYLGPLLDEAERAERYNPDRAEELLRRAESVLLTAGVDGNYAPDQLRERLHAGLRRLETIRLQSDEAQLNQMLEAGDLDGAEAWLEDLLMRRRSTQLEEKLRTVRGQRQLVARYNAALASRDHREYAEAQRLLALVVGESPAFVGPDGRSALEVLDEVTSLKMGTVERPAVAPKRRWSPGVGSILATALVSGLAVTLYFRTGAEQVTGEAAERAPHSRQTVQQPSTTGVAGSSANGGAAPTVLILDGQAPQLAEKAPDQGQVTEPVPSLEAAGPVASLPIAAGPQAAAPASPLIGAAAFPTTASSAPPGAGAPVNAAPANAAPVNVPSANAAPANAAPVNAPSAHTAPVNVAAAPEAASRAPVGPATPVSSPTGATVANKASSPPAALSRPVQSASPLAADARPSTAATAPLAPKTAAPVAPGRALPAAARAPIASLQQPVQPAGRPTGRPTATPPDKTLVARAEIPVPAPLPATPAALPTATDASDPYQAGLEAARAGRTDEALADFRRALEQNPTRAEVYADLGDLYQRQGRSMDALRSYQRSVALNDRLARAHYALGRLHQTQGHHDEAVSAFQAVIRLDSMSAMGHDAQVRLKQLQRAATPPANVWGDSATQTAPAPVQLFTGQ